MKTIAYLDCPSGISGDMCLGAVLDAGVPLDYLQTQLHRLGLEDEFQLSATSVLRQGLRALKAKVELTEPAFAAEPDPWDTDPESESAPDSAHGHSAHGHSAHGHPGHRRHGPRHSDHRPGSRHRHQGRADSHSHSHVHTDGHSTVSSSAHSTTRIIHNGEVQVHHHHAYRHSHSPDPAEAHHPPDNYAEPSPDPSHSHAPGTRHLPEIEALITQAGLPDRACRWSLAVFRQLAEAEAAVHGIAVDQVHFHEVGATDALVDIVGTCLGLDYLGIDALFCSALPTGQGRVKAAHGWLPVPAPAVLKLMEMRNIPLYSNGIQGELVTPTGAALVAALAQGFGDPPAMTLQRLGLGAGQKDFPQANILRLWVGTDSATGSASETSPQTETIAVLETQVDDMVPQTMGYLYDRLFEAGALDVFSQPIAMKKSRPGLLITVLCLPEAEARCTEVLFAETPTLGIRHRHQARTILRREFHRLETPYGPVSMKVAYHPQTQAVLNVHPEYEDCAALARQHDVPWQVVYHTALGLWYQTPPSTATQPASE
ncbi:TIGR00299 family protein [Leptolyngbya sp. BL0902]|uniref:nickel pincer cofactor biosynthesis protein LarC n=1 Tax=Leptolyngbya sp. BL0902 TaxID=1115757 RepID=UPI0018E7B5A3|nr:nickel pincer cofactor biosynthesis protein LarC [Leptolyngbya sp. BL0902]QQE64211.1 TIGR00299 family protein [Leptolyngbya sp. BL0902]